MLYVLYHPFSGSTLALALALYAANIMRCKSQEGMSPLGVFVYTTVCKAALAQEQYSSSLDAAVTCPLGWPDTGALCLWPQDYPKELPASAKIGFTVINQVPCSSDALRA